MKKSLTKFGNSYGIILDKAILELLGINYDTELNISTPDGKSLLIVPETDEGSDRVINSLAKMNSRYPNALKDLPDS